MPKPVTPDTETPQVKPDPTLEKRNRRIFDPDYKLSIFQQAGACEHGELGALVRHEKLYSNQLPQWHRVCENGALKIR